MEQCWQRLPNELVALIVNYLDAATRRDLWAQCKVFHPPRRLETLPLLDLHHDDIDYLMGYPALLIRIEYKTIQFMWSNRYFVYHRTKHEPMFIANGLAVYKTVNTIQNHYEYQY
jgi:hypothetical protein